MKIRNLVKLPEKNKPIDTSDFWRGYRLGKNDMMDEIGNIEVSIKKLKEIINAYEKRNR